VPKPVTSVRVAPGHRDVLRRVVGLIDAGRADELRRALDGLEGAAPLGPFPSAEAAIEDAVFRLVAQLRPEEVWLFGSRARGDHRPDSDIDLLVVLPDGLPPESYTLRAANRPLLGGGAPVEVFPVARGVFDAGDPGLLLGGIVDAARAEGRRLYAARRPPAAVVSRRAEAA
jgi:uncharacterized protein